MNNSLPTRRVALVTGAARGIGLAASRSLLLRGHHVLMADRVAVDLEAIEPEYHSSVTPLAFDVCDVEAAEEVLSRARETLGSVDILINNAGISLKQPSGRSSGILDMTSGEWEQTFAVNVTAAMRLCQFALPSMRDKGWGRIINLTSVAGRTNSRVAGPAYMATKAAIIGLTRSIASEMGRHGVTANCVAPGRILTEMAIQAGERVNAEYAAVIPVGRLGTAEEVGASIAYLCSEEAGFVNGAIIDINGGFFMP
jgi:3-oxoacyl-[acyl-carrier protein] reductase